MGRQQVLAACCRHLRVWELLDFWVLVHFWVPAAEAEGVPSAMAGATLTVVQALLMLAAQQLLHRLHRCIWRWWGPRLRGCQLLFRLLVLQCFELLRGVWRCCEWECQAKVRLSAGVQDCTNKLEAEAGRVLP